MSTALAEPATQTLDELAVEINEHHHAAEASMRSGLEHALEAGRLLIEAKRQCAYGTWGAWIGANCEFSERTAQAYMRLSRRWPELEGKAQRVADLSFRRAMRAVASNTQKIAALPERRRQAVLDAWEEHDCANAHQAVYRAGAEPIDDDLLCERCCDVPVEHEGDYCPKCQSLNNAGVKAAAQAVLRGEDPFEGLLEMLQVPPETLAMAATVLASGHQDLIDAVDGGTMELTQAVAEIQRRRSEPTCPNCGCREVDDDGGDGDCAVCREPGGTFAPSGGLSDAERRLCEIRSELLARHEDLDRARREVRELEELIADLEAEARALKAKKGSSTYKRFVEKHGHDVFELEALPPDTLQELLRDAIDSVMDVGALNHEIGEEKKDAAFLAEARQVATAALTDMA